MWHEEVCARPPTSRASTTTARPPLRFHDLRHTYASHLILDLEQDVVQVSRVLGHASTSITLDIYTHLFDQARHHKEMRDRLTHSRFAKMLEPDQAASALVVDLRSR